MGLTMSTPSIQLQPSAEVQYLLRVGDTCLILAQRIAQWCGHAPILEEDIALTNMALDLVGQARAVLTRAGQCHGEQQGTAFDEDQLAFLRDERDYRNPSLVELPRGDFAFTVLRNALVATLLKALWQRLQSSRDTEVAAIAGKALKEARYHQEHAADWVVRLGGGTEESARRLRDALGAMWRFVPELFEDDDIDNGAAEAGLGPRWSELRAQWEDEVGQLLSAAGLAMPAHTAFRSTGKRGVHTEHMGFLLAEMQSLQRAYPGGVW